MNIVQHVVQRKAYFSHTNHLLFAMCVVEDDAVRRNAVNKIRNLRHQRNFNIQEKSISKHKKGDERYNFNKGLFSQTIMWVIKNRKKCEQHDLWKHSKSHPFRFQFLLQRNKWQ